jgi:histidine triad (HIT) family protein
MSNCVFCKIVSGEIPGKFVYRDRDFIVINDINPRSAVHMLVIPTHHISDFMHTDAQLLKKLTELLKKLITDKSVKSYRIVTNGDGAAVVDHFHVHLMGRVAKDRDL